MATFFGLSFLITKAGLLEMPPMVLISWRFGLAAIILTLLRGMRVIHINYRGKPLKGIFLLSILYPGIAFFFETVGLQYVSSSQAGILVSMMPVFVTLFGALILKEQPSYAQIFYIILSVAGVLITVIFVKNSGDNGTFLGIILILVSVLGGAMNNVLSRKYSKYFTAMEITYMMICLGAVEFSGLSLIQGIFNREILKTYAIPFTSPEIMFVILELSIGTSVVAFFCMNYMLSRLKAANASVFFNLSTVISIAAGIVVVGETLRWYQIAGGLLIIISVWGMNYRKNR